MRSSAREMQFQVIGGTTPLILVPSHMSGVGPFNFILDSGPTHCLLFPELAGFGGSQPAPEALLSDRIGPALKLTVDGAIGFSFMKDFRLSIDYRRKVVWRSAIRRRLSLLAFLLVLFWPLTAQATTAVTGTIQNLGTGNIGQAAFVRFWLRGCGGNQPRVNGTSIIGPSQGGVFFFDFAANSSGVISGTIYSTRDSTGLLAGDIECGGSKTAVWYGMQVWVNGKAGPEIPIHANNRTTLDITQVTPITTNPVISSPTGDSTYLRLDAGNSPVTGNLTLNGTLGVKGAASLSIVNNVVKADQQTGADACEQITAAQALLPSTGGLVDARGFQGSLSACPTTDSVGGGFTIGGASKPVTLLTGKATFTVNAPVIIGGSSSHVIGSGSGQQTIFFQGASFPANTPVLQIGNGSVLASATFENLNVNCNVVANSIGAENAWGQELSGFFGDTIQNCTEYGVWYEGSNAQNSGGGRLYVLNGNATSSTKGIWVHNVTQFRGIQDATISTNDASVEGVGLSIDGSNGLFIGIHLELSTKGIDMGAVTGSVANFEHISGGDASTTDLITIENTAGNRAIFKDIINENSGSTNTIHDLVNGVTRTDPTLPLYIASSGSGPQTVGDKFRFPSFSMLEQAAPFAGTSGADDCYGNSSVHAMECAWNNGTYYRMTQFADMGQVYNAAGTQQVNPHIVEDRGSLSSGTPSTLTVTLSGSAAFTSSSSYNCVPANKSNTTDLLKVSYTSGSEFVITGPNTVTDAVSYICVGN